VTLVSKHPYHGRVYAYLGCTSYARHGAAVCANRVTARVEDAEQALLAGVQTEVTRPETLDDIVATLSTAFATAMAARPTRREALCAQRAEVALKITHLVSAVEAGMATTALLQQLRARETELRRLDTALAELDTPLTPERLTVIPSWVKQQVSDGRHPSTGSARARPSRALAARHSVHPSPRG
jgi:hypothetical protein